MLPPRLPFALVIAALATAPIARATAQVARPPATSTAAGQTTPTIQVVTPESAVLRALLANPATAPYRYSVGRKDGRLVLSGRVGTKEVHDVALRLAMTVTPSIDDRLVIDTAEVNRAAAVGASGFAPSAGPPYIYPQPLFGRLDEPFYGFEPPIISYPPWWGAVAARRGDPYAAPVLDPYSPIGPDPGPSRLQPPAAPAPAAAQPAHSSENPAVEMTLDPRGVAVLRGTVPSEDIRLGIAQKAGRLDGVREVINLLEVRPDPQPAAAIRPQDVPPPPPRPDNGPAPASTTLTPDDAVPASPPAGNDLGQRVARSIDRRPALKDTAVKVDVRDGVAYLSGKAPTAYEAMLAFRAAQQTVGVRAVVDRLQFAVPDGRKPNPLIDKGRPEDVEPYLEAQIRRQLADRAQIDRVRVSGDRLELRGTIARAEDRAGVEAVIRSMPLLRGYTVDARLTAE